METPTITFDQLSHVVSGLSEKLDRVLNILEKVGIANPIKNIKPSRRLVYAKEACQIIGKSLSSLFRGIKAPNDPIPSYKLGKDNKHQVAISNDTFDRVERIARIFGGAGYSVGNFVEHIINEHLDNNSANYESWFTLISKSF